MAVVEHLVTVLMRVLPPLAFQGLALLVILWGALLVLALQVLVHPRRSLRNLFAPRNRDRHAKTLADPKYGVHGFVTSNGVKLHYVAQGNPKNPLLLFLHGFPEFWFEWRHQLSTLSKDYYAVALDQRGYGDSDKPATIEAYRRSTLVDDIRNTIGALGHTSATIVAHDWGGAVATDFAVMHKDMVTKLVLINTLYMPSFQKLLQRPPQFMKSWYALFFQIPLLPELLLRITDGDILFVKGVQKVSAPNAYSDEHIEILKYAFFKPGTPTAALNWYRAGFLFPLKHKKSAKITAPTLLLWGEKDQALTRACADGIRDVCTNIKTHFFPDNSHWITAENPQTITAHIGAFLAS